MEFINTHCHSRYCGHGNGEISEYVEAAKQAGITTLAFTEHYPLSDDFDPVGYLSIPWNELDDYIDAVKKAQDDNDDIEIILGTEFDYLSDYEDREDVFDQISRFDLVLGSVHFVDKWPFDDPAQRGVWDEEGKAEEIWRRYIDIWCEAAADGSLPIDVMSHPDLAKKFNYYPTFDLSESYERMAEAAKSGNKMVEVNTSGSYYLCEEPFPCLELLKEFNKAGVPCTVGTDSHEPRYVARDIEEGYRLLRAAGYDHITVPTSDRDRRTVEI